MNNVLRKLQRNWRPVTGSIILAGFAAGIILLLTDKYGFLPTVMLLGCVAGAAGLFILAIFWISNSDWF